MLPRSLILLLLLCLAPASAYAQALDRQEGGAACLAQAGACAAGLDDPAALWLNPALMAGARARIGLGFGVLQGDRSVQRLRPVNPFAEVRDAAGPRPLGHLALAQPLPWWGGRITVAAGYRLGLNSSAAYPASYKSPGATGTAQPRNDPGRYLGTGLGLQEHLAYLGLALRWRWLSVGAALELGHLRLTHERSLWAGRKADLQRLDDPALDLAARLDLHTPSVAPGGVFGLAAAPSPYFSAGLAVRLPVTHALEGALALSPPTGTPSGFTSVTSRGGDAALELELPLQVHGGVSAGWPLLRLHLDIVWARWSTADRPVASLEDAAITLVPASGGASEQVKISTLPLGIGLRDGISVRGGLASELPGGFLTLRVGYSYTRGASDPDLPSAVLLDLDRHTMGLGVELAAGPVRLGLALAQAFGVTLDAAAAAADMHNPLSPSLTANVGQGRYKASTTRAMLEVKAAW